MNRYDIASRFAVSMFDCEYVNESQLSLFHLLFDLYRTGQLFIPQLLFDTVREVEKQVLINDFKYHDNQNDSQNEETVYQLLNSSIRFFI